MTRRLLLAVGLALAPGAPARASTIPLLDVPVGTKTVSAGVDASTVHLSGDWATAVWGRNLTVGLAAGFDWRSPYARDTSSMLALRLGHRLGGEWPTSWGVLLSAGANLVDPTQPLPSRTSQAFSSQFLPWVQPAVTFSTALDFQRTLWIRASFGPVIGRFTEGAFLMPWLVPSAEAAYRFAPSWEAVFGGGYASPLGLSVRAAF